MKKIEIITIVAICLLSFSMIKSHADVPDQVSEDCKIVTVIDPTGVAAPYSIEDIKGKVETAQKQEMYGFQQVQQAHIVLSYFLPMLNEVEQCVNSQNNGG